MNKSLMNVHPRLIISLGIHSAAIIAFQLALMQLISIVQWHHFAYMIISIAMLGFGASGTLLALGREKLVRMSDWLVPLLMTASGLFMMVAFHITRFEVFQFDVYLLFLERSQLPVLAANYIIFFVPFFAGALAIGIIFIKHASQIGTYYFSNLIGSGIGGIMVLFLFGNIFPQQVPPLIGLLSVISGLLSMPAKFRGGHIGLAAIALLVAIFLIRQPGPIPISEYKSLAQTLNLPEAKVIHSEPDIHGLIDVVDSPALRYAPALSLSFTGEVPVKKNIFVDGNFFGVIPKYEEGQTSHILDYTTEKLPWVAGDRQKILMINAGEGAPLTHAFSHSPTHVDAIIANEGVVNLMQDRFAEASGNLFHHDKLHIHSVEARNYLASIEKAGYDLISLPQQDAFGGTAGINALEENYTMTLESFELMWDHLSPEGVIKISAWTDYPSRTNLKLLATLVETAKNQGVENPSKHLAAIRSWGTITFILKKTPLEKEEINRIREFSAERYFDPLLLPGITPEERQRYNSIEDEAFFSYIDRIVEGDEDFLYAYGFMIHPATDDKPYFSQFLKLGNLRKLSDLFGGGQVPFLELGYLVVVVTLAQSILLALLFIVAPLLRLRKSKRGKIGTLFYFGALGVGYMFVEIILIQRFVLYFGHPVYALSAVISTMLIASGAGSLTSGKLPAIPRSHVSIGMIITLMLLFYAFFLTPILQNTIASPITVKVMLSLMLIGIPSFFKGMMFPLGIRYLSGYDPGQTPWAWGINGSFSVISTSMAMLIAVQAGYIVVMMVAVICYAVAFGVFALHSIFFKVKQP